VAEREVAVQHRERLARMKTDKDIFMEKLKEERKAVYLVSQLQSFYSSGFYCFVASTVRLLTISCCPDCSLLHIVFTKTLLAM
jgi:hypothetical protein